MLALLRSASFWPPSMVNISVINTQTLQITFIHVIFTEKFSPLPGFEPGTSPVPSRYTTNWALPVWIGFLMYQLGLDKGFNMFQEPVEQEVGFFTKVRVSEVFQTFFVDFRCEIPAKGWKRLKQVFWPAFGCCPHPKAGRHTQQLINLKGFCTSILSL